MKRCTNCNVNVYGHHTQCPLCNKDLGITKESSKQYVHYEYEQVRVKLLQRKLVRIFLVIAPLLLVAINLLTYQKVPYLWSMVLIFGSLYSGLFMGNTLNPSRPLGGRIILNYIFLFVWLFVIEMSLGFQGWSVDYILPLSSVVASIVCVVDLFTHQHLYDELVVYILIMILIDLIPVVILAFRKTSVLWPSLVALGVSLVMILIMYLFNRNKLKQEIKKRIHS